MISVLWLPEHRDQGICVWPGFYAPTSTSMWDTMSHPDHTGADQYHHILPTSNNILQQNRYMIPYWATAHHSA